jgi:hypothetical protein
VGAAIVFADGRIFRAVLGQEEIGLHPSTDAPLIGQRIPLWDTVVDAARRCSGALDLGYVGVDLVIDADAGVQVLECNAYPGLEIQNINAAGLGGRIAQAERVLRERRRPRPCAIPVHHHGQRYAGVRPIAAAGAFMRAQAVQMARAWQAPLAISGQGLPGHRAWHDAGALSA